MQGMKLLVSAEYWYLCLAHYGSDVLEQKASRQDIDKHSIVWMCETGLTCLNRRQVARTLTMFNHLDVVQYPSKKRPGLGGVVVHRAVHVVDVLDLLGGDEAAKEFQLAGPECMDEQRWSELVHWGAHRLAHHVRF